MTNNNSNNILRALEKSGFSSDYISSVLPDWWDQAATDNPVGLAEFKLMLSRNLGLDINSLSAADEQLDLQFKLPHDRKLKRGVRYNDMELAPAMSIGLSCARIAISACPVQASTLPDALTLRKYILEDLGANYVSFKSLLMACWHHGVPVIHITHYPDGMPKMDGMLTVIDKRPAIVLAKNTPFNAWMSFILAHEIGHLAYGHCQSGELLVDEDMEFSKINNEAIDDDEAAADQYALSLLSGDQDLSDIISPDMKPTQMAKTAMEYQRSTSIDAGHILLRHAFSSGDWQTPLAALKLLDQKIHPIDEVRNGQMNYLDDSLTSESSMKFLLKMTGISN